MFILTSDVSSTYKAQIRASAAHGFRQLYTGTCTMGSAQAARNLVEKYFSRAAAATVREVKDKTEIAALCGDFFKDPRRKQVFQIWTFDSRASPKGHGRRAVAGTQDDG